jgi:hypothetical protein
LAIDASRSSTARAVGGRIPCRALATTSCWLFDIDASISPLANSRCMAATSGG